MLQKPALSSNMPQGRPTHGPSHPNPAHMEVDSGPAVTVPLHASAGIKRETSDAQLPDQQPIKAARTGAEPQSAHLHGRGHVDNGSRVQGKVHAQAAVSHAMLQTTATLKASNGQSYSALAFQRSPQQQSTQLVDVSIKQQMSEQHSLSLSPVAQSAVKAALFAHVSGDVTPIKLEWEPVPIGELNKSQDATSTAATVMAGAASEAAAAAGQSMPASAGMQGQPEEVVTAAEQDSIILDDSPSPDAANPQRQASTVKSELQFAPSNFFDKHVVYDRAKTTCIPTDAGSVMIKADPAAGSMAEMNDMQRIAQVKFEPEGVPIGQQGAHETSLASGLYSTAPTSSCAATAEGLSVLPHASAGKLVAPGSKMVEAKPEISSNGYLSSAPQAQYISAPTSQGHLPSGLAIPMSDRPLAPSAGPTVQVVSPLTAVPTGTGSTCLGPAAACTTGLPVPTKQETVNIAVKDPGHTQVETAKPTRPSSMFHTADVSALLAKRKQELLVNAAFSGGSPAECMQSCAEEVKDIQMA